MHYCTWKRCGAPATKSVRLELTQPFYNQIHEDGTITREKADGKTVWLCDEHYADPAPWAHWEGMIITP